MQHVTVKGLVLRETVFGEADKLIDLLTESGIRTVGVRSARKPGSKYAAVTQAFSYGEFCLRQTGERFWLDSAVSVNMFFGVRQRLDALALAAYFSELIRKTATDQPQPQLLRLFLYCLQRLEQDDRPLEQIKGTFELRLMTELGMMPNLVCCASCMQYQPRGPIMRVAKADFLCADCADPEEITPDEIPVTQSTLQALRHVVFSDMDRIFGFRLKGTSLRLFAAYCERYTLYRLGTGFRTLKFYHDLNQPQDTEHG